MGEDEYPDSGEYVDPRSGRAEQISLRMGEEGAGGGAAAAGGGFGEQYGDEYPDCGECVPAPGGTASIKWWRWR